MDVLGPVSSCYLSFDTDSGVSIKIEISGERQLHLWWHVPEATYLIIIRLIFLIFLFDLDNGLILWKSFYKCHNAWSSRFVEIIIITGTSLIGFTVSQHVVCLKESHLSVRKTFQEKCRPLCSLRSTQDKKQQAPFFFDQGLRSDLLIFSYFSSLLRNR